MRIITIPRIGKYTDIFKSTLEELGLNIQLPPITTEQTIKWGCKYSSDMVCYPYKVTLGNFKEAIENGANTLLMFDSRGTCRFRHYWVLQEAILRKQGYDFEMYPLSSKTIFKVFKTLNPKLSHWRILKVLYKCWKEIKETDKQYFKEGINIGLIGEIYTCLEPTVNLNLEGKLRDLGVNVYNTVTMHDFLAESLKNMFKLSFNKRDYKKRAEKCLNGKLGGHGFENIYNLLWLIDNNIKGVIHLLPLSCMPETTVEPIIDRICNENNLPLLRLPIDETNSEANVNTRVEAFIELIKRR